jgi:hypothetical protein
LNKLGHLTSVLGDEAGARKVDERSQNRPPTNRERLWIERCVLTLIRRAGELAGDQEKALPKIKLENLPP